MACSGAEAGGLDRVRGCLGRPNRRQGLSQELCALSQRADRGGRSSLEPLEVGEVLLLREAAIPMTDGPPARAGSSLPKRELSLILYSLYQQVLLALSLEYKQNLTTS